MAENGRERILGIDLGTNSIGWALIDYENSEPKGIAGIGVRVFEAGVTGDIQSGRDESRNKARREKRLQRRQFDRRARRLANVARLLQEAGLLPAGDFKDKQVLHDTLMALDRELYRRYASTLSDNVKLHRTFPHVLPYWLRARALDQRLASDELGRALYHLAQRRGFLSNRKATGKKESEEERGKVKQGIAELEHKMEETGARTLGEYFAGIDPEQERIRTRWTARKMYEHEFESIWSAQTRHHADIFADAFKRKLHRAIFKQRPLKIQKNLIGKCELEPGQRRAPWATLEAQRFRLLQKVNDFQILQPDRLRRKLTEEERTTLLNALELDGDQKFKDIRTLLKLPKSTKFSHEAGGEEKLPGNRTASKLYAVFGERWLAFSDEEKARIVEDVRSIRSEEVLAKRGKRVWAINEDKAKEFGAVSLQEEYCGLSKRALVKILPLMETGEHYMTALEKVYPERRAAWNVLDALPSVAQAPLGELRNPMVERSLNELRKVVNAIVKKHGKPGRIRIELARDLKKNRKNRETISKNNRDNERSRTKAAKRILDEIGVETKKRDDILKVLLAEECNWECPYTGRHISMRALLGDSPQFDIDHIIPRSRLLDDSFMNKTLCNAEVNRTIKGKMTPYEAFGSDSDTWNQIIERVKRFKGRAADAKLDRFRLEDVESLDGFTNRQLNDTRFASLRSGDYVGLLYGGQIDTDGTRRIQVSRGEITSKLREVWNLNRILGDGQEKKSRSDHRHHAVDAICIALTSPRIVKLLSDAAQRAPEEKKRRFASVPEPWNGFYDDVKKAIDGIVVSHRVDRRVNGPLHKETLYSLKEYQDENGKTCVHLRAYVHDLTPSDIGLIVDPVVRQVVTDKNQALGGSLKSIQSLKDYPMLTTKDGRRIPIKRVRIWQRVATQVVAQEARTERKRLGGNNPQITRSWPDGVRARRVKLGGNHHLEFFGILDASDKVTRWKALRVSRYKALTRLKSKLGEPLINRVGDPQWGRSTFLFSLAPGELFEIDGPNGSRDRCVCRTISEEQGGAINVEFVQNNDARLKDDIKIAKQWRKKSDDALRKVNFSKITVTPLGEIRRAND